MTQASNYSKWTLLAQATTALTSSIEGEVDMANFDGCEFVFTTDSTGPGATLTISSAATTTGTFQDLSGGSQNTTAGNDFGVIDVYRPRLRFLKAKTTTDTTVGGRHVILARQYGPRKLQSGTSYDTLVVSAGT